MEAVSISILLFALSHLLFVSPSYAQSPTEAIPLSIQHTIHKINVNTAQASQLVHAIKGIGQKRAASIIEYREEHGAFRTVDELAYVHGLGVAFVKRNREALEAVFEFK